MTTLDIADLRRDLRTNGNTFSESALNPPAELRAPPLVPNEPTVIGGEDVFQSEDAFHSIALSDPSPTFLSRRNLIAGAASVTVAIGVAALAYFLFASPAAKVPAETPATAVQSPEPSSPRAGSSSATPVQPAPTSVTAAEPPDVAASVNPDVVFLQRPGVNIRSAPSSSAPVLGTAPKGTQFTASGWDGDWVQVENTRLKGWINSQFLAANKPQ
jgi:hypothetical protein